MSLHGYVETRARLLELTRNMHRLFEKQEAAEKRRLLNFVVSNSVWKDDEIVPTWRQPFDMIADANRSKEEETAKAAFENANFENRLPFVDSYRTFLARGIADTAARSSWFSIPSVDYFRPLQRM